ITQRGIAGALLGTGTDDLDLGPLLDAIEKRRDGAAGKNKDMLHLVAQESVQHQLGAFTRLGGDVGPHRTHGFHGFFPKMMDSRPMPCAAQEAVSAQNRTRSWRNSAVSNALRSLWHSRPSAGLPT